VATVGLLFTLLGHFTVFAPGDPGEHHEQEQDLVLAMGSVEDAAGVKKTLRGDVICFPAGGSVFGTFKREVKDGNFTISIPKKGVPTPPKGWPLMIKLSFYVRDTNTGKRFPARHVENLSPYGKQELHIVVYTDDQLAKADLDVLFEEYQQLEKSLLAWQRADKEFKAQYKDYFSPEFLHSRQKLIIPLWQDAAAKKSLPQEFSSFVRGRMDKLGESMNTFLK
jgi:hypothetical protein